VTGSQMVAALSREYSLSVSLYLACRRWAQTAAPSPSSRDKTHG
jgi:hypothetical protein